MKEDGITGIVFTFPHKIIEMNKIYETIVCKTLDIRQTNEVTYDCLILLYEELMGHDARKENQKWSQPSG